LTVHGLISAPPDRIEDTMTSTAKNVVGIRRLAPTRRRPTPADEDERFRELAYRLVYCTDTDEEQRLKAEVVRAVMRRGRRLGQNSGEGER
jgi:hypothetical protein